VDGTTVEKKLLGHRRFTGVRVRDDRESPTAVDLVYNILVHIYCLSGPVIRNTGESDPICRAGLVTYTKYDIMMVIVLHRRRSRAPHQAAAEEGDPVTSLENKPQHYISLAP
jgi:hypothetical protein